MKTILSILAITSSLAAVAQTDTVPANVYNLNKLEVKKDSSRDRIQVLDGSTLDLANLEVHISILEPGKAAHPPHTHADTEELMIVKEGKLKITIKGKSKVMGPGSVALALPGDEHGAVNAGNTKAVYYILKLKAKAPVNAARGAQAGGSLMVDWSDVAVQKTDKGEKRQIFERPTALFGKLEMHVTTLNAGEVSHLPHTHRAEEMVVLRKGDINMQIGDKFYKATAGDVIFLSSGVLHALKNIGSGQCEYYAFQWQL